MTTATVNDRRRYSASTPGRRTVGTAIVIALHLLIAWALVTGTARDAFKIIKKPLEAAVIQEVIIPPPPPPPPPPPKKIEQPKQIEQPKAPPPPFVPPPDIPPPQTSAPTIQSVQAPPPTPAVIAPPPPPAAPPGPARAEIGVICPTQVKPEIPRQAQREGVEGEVTAQAVIRGGKVVEVQILSGPRAYHGAVRSAMMQYQCQTSGAAEVIATQVFSFKLN